MAQIPLQFVFDEELEWPKCGKKFRKDELIVFEDIQKINLDKIPIDPFWNVREVVTRC